MKNPVLSEEQALSLRACCVCGKKITYGYYGRWEDGGTCSRGCERTKESQPKLHGGQLCNPASDAGGD